MKTLTIITTTYNRAYCLGQLYQSLVEQESKDLVWLIVDDGSTDNTMEIVEHWKNEGIIEIEYYYKQNGGMHTARNFAYQKVNTEINIIVDSDDWLAKNAVDRIVSYWNENKSDKVAGMITQNADPKGNIIGSIIPDGLKSCSYIDFFHKYKMNGDKKLIYRSNLTKLYPFPEFQGEKFYPASYKYYLIDKDYDLLVSDMVTCIVNYTDDSMTRDKYAQYKTCPIGFMHYRKTMLKQKLGATEKVKNMIHYVMENSIAHVQVDRDILTNPLFYICYVPGKLFYQYIIHTHRKY